MWHAQADSRASHCYPVPITCGRSLERKVFSWHWILGRIVCIVSCAVGISESSGKVFSCGFVEASEMFPQGVWSTWQVLSPFTFTATGQVSSMLAPTSWELLGMSALPTNAGVSISGLSRPAFTWAQG